MWDLLQAIDRDVAGVCMRKRGGSCRLEASPSLQLASGAENRLQLVSAERVPKSHDQLY